ncbi:hypothetical protein M758_2G034900 [Ceratodon purpureus]|uniref:DUF952 domain-containing protein n=1 Tax=Ceratodon purpureus TaxID=3225 RepID=A0A8T0ISK5_CERPU|nr:hypothetical protein KC19_2G036000 [Ceratodon purpureus]KAG0625191.1 hypothetical protein M758_2G034900 [Ceratodon purpureus]KAG0625192.1 hypothetical protein M758_2G034900 [Ceratodon purpureus]
MAEAITPQAYVYRISPEDEWAAAQAAGALQGGQLDTTSGYIHLSTAAQVAGTLALFYAGRSDLFLLKVNAAKLGDGLRYDEVEGVGLFPHFYGPDGAFTPLPLSAVEDSAKIELEKGQHVLPFDLTNN